MVIRIAGGVVLLLLRTALGLGRQRRRHGGARVRHGEGTRHLGVAGREKPAFGGARWRLRFQTDRTEAYKGVTVSLEAHKQDESIYRPAWDGSTLQRFGELTAAAVLQLLQGNRKSSSSRGRSQRRGIAPFTPTAIVWLDRPALNVGG